MGAEIHQIGVRVRAQQSLCMASVTTTSYTQNYAGIIGPQHNNHNLLSKQKTVIPNTNEKAKLDPPQVFAEGSH